MSRNILETLYYIVLYTVQDGHNIKNLVSISPGSSEI
jgi:hypothetical protein